MTAGPETIQCDRQQMRLSASACSRLYASTLIKKPDAWEGRHHCVGCPVGAGHAGLIVNLVAMASADLASLCSRCTRQSERIVAGRHCPSCYNRDREARLGRNCKGGTPRLAALLHAQVMAVGVAGQRPCLATAERVTGRGEMLLHLAKGATAPMAFGVPPLRLQPPGWQLEMPV